MPKPAIGPCGVHIFNDLERAQRKTCAVCEEAVAFALSTSKSRYLESPNMTRSNAQLRGPSAKAKAAMAGIVRITMGRKRVAAADAARAASELTRTS